MKVWMLWVQGDDVTWLEAAWDEGMMDGNNDGWRDEVGRVRQLALSNGYEMRIQAVEVPGVFGLFDIPAVQARRLDDR